uniref:Uncharacterized protein n=1 Tax=Ralstonia solanacearum TaxID=305 RepID=A0A0S4U2A1_RALSL|nr:protein of unknown function [Ralstonia solanacearum]
MWQLLGVTLGSASGERFIAGSNGLAGSAGEMLAVRRGGRASVGRAGRPSCNDGFPRQTHE